MESIILIGGGGHAKSIIDAIRGGGQWDIVGIIDIESKIGQNVDDVPIIATDAELEKLYKQGIAYAFVSVGSTGETDIRKQLVEKASDLGFLFPNIIDETAVIAKNAILGSGNFIGKKAIINAGSCIGNHTIINTGAIIEHDCQIEDYVHIATGSVLCGGVKVGEDTHIGANATVIQYKTIGKNVMIGAGSVVTRDISNAKKAYGNPCKEVEK